MGIDYEGYIKEKMQKRPITISPDASFYEARALISDKGIRHLPVVDKNGHLVGILTDRDIREAAPSDATSLSAHELHYLLGKLKVSGFMTSKDKLITITPDLILEDAPGQMHGVLEIMKKNNVNIISIVSPTFKVNGKRVAAIRIQTHEYENIVKELNQKGYEVIS